jgi:dienelactone hydrolase
MTAPVLLAAWVSLSITGLRGQTIAVSPNRVMTDQAASILVSGLQSGERVSIRGELVDGADGRWSSQADFVADAQGAIDTSKQAPAAGSYKEVSAMGLVWSMKTSSHEGRYQAPRAFGAQTIEFHLMRGKDQVATASLEQAPMAEGVERIPVHDGALRGVLFVPRGANRNPAVLVLGGSEGGLPSRRAAWLASHGFVALALAYFRYEDLPQDLAGIPLEYFGQALNWMAHRSEIATNRIAVMGVSRGGELALQLASMYPVHAVVAYVPANVRYPACCGFTPAPFAWAWNGRGLAYRPLRGAPAAAMGAAIEVEHIRGPVMLISGTADRIWESSSMSDLVVARLKEHHFAFAVEHLKYPHAGHAAGRPEIVPAWQGYTRNPTSGREVEMGGTPQGNAESTLDAIPKVLEFLERVLAPDDADSHGSDQGKFPSACISVNLRLTVCFEDVHFQGPSS